MKNIITLLFLIISFQSFAQNEFEIPYDVPFDPLDSKLATLGIKKIEQLSKQYYYNDSTNALDTLATKFYPDYAFTYDSSFRLISLKYDFQRENQPAFASENRPVEIQIKNDSTRLYKIAQDSTLYNYYEKEYHYENGSLDFIKIHRPYRWIMDGVYFLPQNPSRECIENELMDGLLIRKTYFRDEKIHWVIEYKYEIFKTGSREVKLLTNVLERSRSRIERETVVKYY